MAPEVKSPRALAEAAAQAARDRKYAEAVRLWAEGAELLGAEARSAQGTARSRKFSSARQMLAEAKRLERLTQTLTFADVVNMESVKEAVRKQIIVPLASPESARRFRITPAAQVLVYGPPGTGKTFFAKALAGELGFAFFEGRANDLMGSYVGESEKNVAALFEKARTVGRAVVFIDEVDSFLRARTAGDHDVTRRVHNQFLSEISRLKEEASFERPLVFVGATNAADQLDAAVLSRFEYRYYIGMPGPEEREEMLRREFDGVPSSGDLDFAEAGRELEGYSFRDLAQRCSKCRVSVHAEHVEREDRVVTQADLAAHIRNNPPSVRAQVIEEFDRIAVELGDLQAVPSAGPAAQRLSATDAIRPSSGTEAAAQPVCPLPGVKRVVVQIGATEGDQAPMEWTPSTQSSPHLFIVGMPGQGKSVTTARIAQSCVQQGLRTLALDFHGELAQQAPALLEPGQYRVVDAAQGIPFSPFDFTRVGEGEPGQWRSEIFSIAEILGWVCELGDIQQDLIYEAIRNRALADGAAPRAPRPDEVFAEVQRLEGEKKVRNVSARVRPLLDADFHLFHPHPSQSLYDLIPGLGILDLHNLVQETAQLATGAFVLRKVYRDMLRWPATDELRLLLVLDEAHRLVRDVTLPKLMKEGRKFGIVLVCASQVLSDLHPDVQTNAGTKVAFRVSYPESRRAAGMICGASSRDDVGAAIEGLAVGEAFVSTPAHESPRVCYMTAPTPG